MARNCAGIDVFTDVAPAMRALSRRDAGLKAATQAIGKPYIRRREGGFQGLFRIIVEQQVSVPSSQAIWKRCQEGVDCASPRAVEALGLEGLKARGLSSPKARYVTEIAKAFSDGEINLAALSEKGDDEAMAGLVTLRGVGPWTASIYLLFCEGRVDIWPPNDVALKHAYNAAANTDLDQKSLDLRAAQWSPWRGVAAHILWTYYAHRRGRTPI